MHIEDLKRIEQLAMRGPWFTDDRLPMEVLRSSNGSLFNFPWELVARVGKPLHFPPNFRDPHTEATMQLITVLRNLAPDLLILWSAARAAAAEATPANLAALAECTQVLDERLGRVPQGA